METFNGSGMHPTLMKLMYDTTPEEMIALNSIVKDMSDEKIHQFCMIYRTKRKDPQTILLCCLLGFVVIAGVHRFMVGEIGMGILYLFTGGLCLVGTIIDAINHKEIALNYNQKMIHETMLMMNVGQRTM